MVCFTVEGALGPNIGVKGTVGEDGLDGDVGVGFAEIGGSVSRPEIDNRAAGHYFWQFIQRGGLF
jgi:hypothetical protein